MFGDQLNGLQTVLHCVGIKDFSERHNRGEIDIYCQMFQLNMSEHNLASFCMSGEFDCGGFATVTCGSGGGTIGLQLIILGN